MRTRTPRGCIVPMTMTIAATPTTMSGSTRRKPNTELLNAELSPGGGYGSEKQENGVCVEFHVGNLQLCGSKPRRRGASGG